ncbi:MAG TPA: family 78 glycoside hydrolase catalytic domain, partial [Candidatus Alistipes merdigallinarum]|nr:family 78 glycoside hydrolase catalytic domain [Candidatus Alistipes merdigallinarum]
MKAKYLISFFLTGLCFVSCTTDESTRITENTVELLKNPVGVAAEQPRFSWKIDSETPDLMQTAYRIKVAADADDLDQEANLIWDSGITNSDQSVFVPYAGPKLESRKDYWWKVLVTTNKGDSVWSAPAHWSMALLDSADWKAQWIGIDSALNATDAIKSEKTRLAARYLRKEFPVDGAIASARLYISGLGLYECYLNGTQVGKGQLFAPTVSDYTKCVYYNTFDVTDHLKKGENTIGVILGNGRFFSMRYGNNRDFGYPKLLAQLEITYKDGKQEIVTSDDSWKLTTNGPIIANNEFDGEEYDARLEMKEWNKNGFDDKEWMQAKIVNAPQGVLTAQSNPNIKTMETITPIAINQLNDSTLILDMGQNMVGWLAVSLKGTKDKPIRMRFAETLQPDGSLYMANLRGALVTDIYTPAEDGLFSWEPKFTYHGFRFVEITGLDYVPELKEFEGKVNYDEMKTTGSFACSDSTLNQIYHNAFWGIRGNYRGMPTDCPQRDERMGWLGDRAMGSFGESFMFRPTLLYEKWMRDIQDSQLPSGQIPDVSPTYWPFYSENVTWPAAYPCIVDMLYTQYGDVNAVKEHYASLK